MILYNSVNLVHFLYSSSDGHSSDINISVILSIAYSSCNSSCFMLYHFYLFRWYGSQIAIQKREDKLFIALAQGLKKWAIVVAKKLVESTSCEW